MATNPRAAENGQGAWCFFGARSFPLPGLATFRGLASQESFSPTPRRAARRLATQRNENTKDELDIMKLRTPLGGLGLVALLGVAVGTTGCQGAGAFAQVNEKLSQ